MNGYRKRLLALGLLALSALAGCKDYLQEENLSGRTAETYYGTAQGFEDLVKSNYSPLRPVVNYPGLYFLGTDIFTTGDPSATSGLNNYDNNLNSSIADVDSYWKQLYYSIQLTNTTLVWATKVTGLDATTVATRVAEAKALRAYYYYLLAENFGDVPLVLTPVTEPTFGYTRDPEQKVYDQIISDLNDAIGALPVATTANFGRVTKGMAQHLLAKVYLTRGYKSYGAGQTDFNAAGQLAETVINSGNYTLLSDFSKLFDPTVSNFQVNSEVIFSVQYSTNVASNSYAYATAPTTLVSGNGLHNLFTMDLSVYPAISRSALYNKANILVAPTPYFFTLFDKTRDARYQATVYTAIYAQVAAGGFAVGDTVIYFPDVAFSPARKATKKYTVFNPNEYDTQTSYALRSFPSFKKFREVNLAYGDNLGTRDTYVFRLAETYLIAAEAYLQAGNSAKAVAYYNTVRVRAGKAGTNPTTGKLYKDELKVTAVSLDDILDERARELAGESFRWLELKRTGKLVARTNLYNKETAKAGRLQTNDLLRPIPQSQIDLNRGTFTQNPGY
ncbi:MAG: RagB/SusD family nutrient uptake outer membrane protein [Janthinobacterium lividum]